MRPDGTITTGAQTGNIAPAFRPLLERAVERLAAAEGNSSLYVYGSVATGTAQVGCSDVDLVTIGLEAGKAAQLGAWLTAGFPGLSRGVEVGAARPTDYEGPGDTAYGNRVFLRHYCVHLAGPDLARGLPVCRADRAAARGFNGDIGLCADRWRRELADGADPAALARRIGRKTLFAVAGLVSLHDSTWTTDRGTAANRFGVLMPELAASLDTLVAWGNGAAMRPPRPGLQAALDGVVATVVDDFANRIGLWPIAGSAPAD